MYDINNSVETCQLESAVVEYVNESLCGDDVTTHIWPLQPGAGIPDGAMFMGVMILQSRRSSAPSHDSSSTSPSSSTTTPSASSSPATPVAAAAAVEARDNRVMVLSQCWMRVRDAPAVYHGRTITPQQLSHIRSADKPLPNVQKPMHQSRL
jgi:hypothetical protein